jgi:hypothetical protein
MNATPALSAKNGVAHAQPDAAFHQDCCYSEDYKFPDTSYCVYPTRLVGYTNLPPTIQLIVPSQESCYNPPELFNHMAKDTPAASTAQSKRAIRNDTKLEKEQQRKQLIKEKNRQGKKDYSDGV